MHCGCVMHYDVDVCGDDVGVVLCVVGVVLLHMMVL